MIRLEMTDYVAGELVKKLTGFPYNRSIDQHLIDKLLILLDNTLDKIVENDEPPHNRVE